MYFIQWLNVNSGFVMAVLTLVYVIATFYIVKANRSSVLEMRQTREEETRPYVVVYLQRNPNVNGAVHLIVRNIGTTAAYDIRIQATPPIEHPQARPLANSYLLTNNIPNIPPDYTINSFVDMIWNMKQPDGSFPTYKFAVTYASRDGRTFIEEYISDLNTEADVLRLKERTFDDFAKDFESFKVEHLNAIGRLISNLSIDKSNDSSDRVMTLEDIKGFGLGQNSEK